MTTNLSLDEQLVSVVAGSLEKTAGIAKLIASDSGSFSDEEIDDAKGYLNAYSSHLNYPSVPTAEFLSQYSHLRGCCEANPVAVNFFNMWFWGCLGAGLLTGSFPVSVVSGAAAIMSYFYKDKITSDAMEVRREIMTVLDADYEIYAKAFEKLHEAQVEESHVSS